MTQTPSAEFAAPLRQHGRTGEILRLSLINLFLNMVTLSLWRFWGKTRVRRLLWSRTTLWGDPLEYTGRGGELFLGFVVVVLLILLPLAAIAAALEAIMASGHPVAAIGSWALQLLIFFLAGAGLYRAYRYQLTRTQWRGIRAGLDGSAWAYGGLVLGTSIAVMCSLGWALPWAQMQLARYRLEHTRLGDLRLRCNADSTGLYGRFALCWFHCLILITLFPLIIMSEALRAMPSGRIIAAGIVLYLFTMLFLQFSYAVYKAAFYRKLAAATDLDGHAFHLSIRSWPLIRLVLGNTIISSLSLGILLPWAALRTFRFTCRHLQIEGIPDFDRIKQVAADRSRMGEGLASVFDGAGSF